MHTRYQERDEPISPLMQICMIVYIPFHIVCIMYFANHKQDLNQCTSPLYQWVLISAITDIVLVLYIIYHSISSSIATREIQLEDDYFRYSIHSQSPSIWIIVTIIVVELLLVLVACIIGAIIMITNWECLKSNEQVIYISALWWSITLISTIRGIVAIRKIYLNCNRKRELLI